MTHPIIQLKQIHLSLNSGAGETAILKNINLTINAGEKIAILGPSGSGKSSLMNIMTGLENPTSGQIILHDQDISKANEDELAKCRQSHMGIIMQAFHLIPTMTALENVATPMELASDPRAIAKAQAALQQVGLEHRLHHYPTQLSGGEQQRTALARAIVGKPKILFGDEPTGNLDGSTGQKIMDLMLDLAQDKETSLILITHDPLLAQRCQRIIRMQDGLIISDSYNQDPINQDPIQEQAQDQNQGQEMTAQ